MKLYLVRHGDALSANIDLARPLSETGETQADAMAALLAEGGARVARVCHSGKARARQTAERLAPVVAPGVTPESVTNANPNDPARPLYREIYAWREDSLIVGHLPHLSCLASRLLFESELPRAFDFEPAAAACLERFEDGAWSLLWFRGPEIV